MADNAAAIQARLKRAMEAYFQGSGKGARLWAEVVVTTGKRNAPVLTGNLRASGRGDGPVAEGNDLVVAASFGSGVSASYAVRVHQKHNPFFRDAVSAEQSKAQGMISKAAIVEIKKATK